VQQEFINQKYDQAIKDIDSLDASALFVLVYYFYLSEDFNRLFCLLHNSKNVEQ
jgi:hypothetical protein